MQYLLTEEELGKYKHYQTQLKHFDDDLKLTQEKLSRCLEFIKKVAGVAPLVASYVGEDDLPFNQELSMYDMNVEAKRLLETEFKVFMHVDWASGPDRSVTTTFNEDGTLESIDG